jgi:hypothetical protein
MITTSRQELIQYFLQTVPILAVFSASNCILISEVAGTISFYFLHSKILDEIPGQLCSEILDIIPRVAVGFFSDV